MSRRAGIATALLLLLAAAGVGLVRSSRRVEAWRESEARLLADTGGPITLVACAVNSARRSALRNSALVSAIVNAMPPRVRFVLIVNDRSVFTIARDPFPGRVSFVELPADNSMTIWPQDPLLTVQAADGTTRLLASHEFDRAGDQAMAQALAGKLGWECERSTLDFEGGNIVSDERAVFIGANTIRHNAVKRETSDEEIVIEFERELGRAVFVIGPLPQPIGHLDLYLTPLGGGRIALADTGAGADLAEAALEESPEEVAAFERGCEREFFGAAEITQVRVAENQVLSAPPVRGATPSAIEASRRIAGDLDELARVLEGCGFQVARIPFLLGESATAEDQGRLGYPVLTYNNVLLETEDDSDIVYLPQYGFPRLDSGARDAWAGLGYTVRAVPGFAVSAMYGGALRCSVKVLERGS